MKRLAVLNIFYVLVMVAVMAATYAKAGPIPVVADGIVLGAVLFIDGVNWWRARRRERLRPRDISGDIARIAKGADDIEDAIDRLAKAAGMA